MSAYTDLRRRVKIPRNTRDFTLSGWVWVKPRSERKWWYKWFVNILQHKQEITLSPLWSLANIPWSNNYWTHPRSSKYVPFLDSKVFSQLLGILDEIPSGVLLKRRAPATWSKACKVGGSGYAYGVDLPDPRWSKRTICECSHRDEVG